jgi:hypothetical protein
MRSVALSYFIKLNQLVPKNTVFINTPVDGRYFIPTLVVLAFSLICLRVVDLANSCGDAKYPANANMHVIP